MKTIKEIKALILKEDKFSLAYILDYLKPQHFYVISIDVYTKTELRKELIKTLTDIKYFDKLIQLNSYK